MVILMTFNGLQFEFEFESVKFKHLKCEGESWSELETPGLVNMCTDAVYY